MHYHNYSKGEEVEWGSKRRLQNGEAPWLNFSTRLRIRNNAGSLVADMQHQKYLANCIKPSHSAPLILRSLPRLDIILICHITQKRQLLYQTQVI